MKILENMDLCYGCGACANICNYHAISMKPREDGFLYPEVDAAACEHCDACRKVCPQLNADYKNAQKPKTYAVMAGDEIRAKSASGGMFSLLADYVLERGGYVCGAAFTEDFRKVKQVMIHNPVELDGLRRSKYLQSENGDIYRKVKKALSEDAWVLFAGTPCQCAALKSFLRKPYEKLIIADLICHSTPSPLAWNRFLDEIAQGRKAVDVNFRYKGLIGWSETSHIQFDKGDDYLERFKNDTYSQAFSKNLISRKSCGTCQFARIPRQGDITMGDFWGVSAYDKKLNDKKGTSIVLANTPKGEAILKALDADKKMKKLQEVDFYDAFSRNNSNIYHFPQENPGRQKFFDALLSGKKFSDALEISKNEKYDIVLFSIWYAFNFGSLMTNFALYTTLEDMGYRCMFADIPDHLWPESRGHRDPLFKTRRFGNKHFNISPKYKNRTDLKKLNKRADIFLVGSDQIWNYKLCESAGTFFFLDFVEENKRKIAYGTSFGHKEFLGDETARKSAGGYLRRFNAVSVREDYAVELCKNEFGVEAVKVLDPVFLCDKAHYYSCIEDSALSKKPPEKKYLLAYILDPTEAKQKSLEYAAAKLGLELVCIPNAMVKKAMRERWRLPILENLDMEDWLFYFSHAEMVITDSFHGTCFSMIFERPFIAIVNKRRGAERFYSLLEDFELLDRLVASADEIQKRPALFEKQIDYGNVNALLQKRREQSMAWLKNALTMEIQPDVYSAYDMTDNRIDRVLKMMADKEAKLLKQIETQNKTIADLQAQIQNMRTKNE
jgi:coenzyme F420-reducing hydrogenase beta subunit